MNIPILRITKGDAPFSKEAARSYTLPARFYHDAEIYELEKDAIFARNWWYAGHKSQLAEKGSYFTARVHDQSIFVGRGEGGELKAFYNVCQHRGHELLQGTGRTNVIVCPYHAWGYDFDGNLRAARNSENMTGFNKCDFSLKPVRVEELCGLIFVNLDQDAVPLKEQAAGLEDEIRHYAPGVDEVVFAQRDTYEVKSNWKVMVDNFLECYHCHVAHKDFVDLVDMDSYSTTVSGIYSSQLAGAARSTDNSAFTFEKGDVDFGYAGWFLWPNLTIWVYPGEPNISVLQMIPNGPDGTIEYQDWFLPTAKPSSQVAEAMAYQKDVLQPEDISLCESVQRGLKSNGYNQGRFVVDKTESELSEHAVHHFQALVADALGAELE